VCVRARELWRERAPATTSVPAHERERARACVCVCVCVCVHVCTRAYRHAHTHTPEGHSAAEHPFRASLAAVFDLRPPAAPGVALSAPPSVCVCVCVCVFELLHLFTH